MPEWHRQIHRPAQSGDGPKRNGGKRLHRCPALWTTHSVGALSITQQLVASMREIDNRMKARPEVSPAVIRLPAATARQVDRATETHQARSLFAGQATGPSFCVYGRRPYAAAAFGVLIFFLGFAFFSSNSKPTFPFSNFR